MIADLEMFEEPKMNGQFPRHEITRMQRRDASLMALGAMDRLADLLKKRNGQAGQLRSLLYSMWNGKPASLLRIVDLDWEIRQDLVMVLEAFGYEDHQVKFFYTAVQDAIQKAGQWEWFLEERANIAELVGYAKTLEREKEGF